jgi:hypothetical protein
MICIVPQRIRAEKVKGGRRYKPYRRRKDR